MSHEKPKYENFVTKIREILEQLFKDIFLREKFLYVSYLVTYGGDTRNSYLVISASLGQALVNSDDAEMSTSFPPHNDRANRVGLGKSPKSSAGLPCQAQIK
jgi:hypothetical protein